MTLDSGMAPKEKAFINEPENLHIKSCISQHLSQGNLCCYKYPFMESRKPLGPKKVEFMH
jgi:hypothetical protein